MLHANQLEPSLKLDADIKYFHFLLEETIKDVPTDEAELRMHTNICSGKNALKAESPKPRDEYIVECVLNAVMVAARIPSVSLFFSKSQRRIVCLPRQIAMYMIRKNTSLGTKKIGKIFRPQTKRFDHSTVVHHCKKVQGWVDNKDEKLMPIYNRAVVNFENLSGIHMERIEK